eukprot:306854-Amphidinium_carterae.2
MASLSLSRLETLVKLRECISLKSRGCPTWPHRLVPPRTSGPVPVLVGMRNLFHAIPTPSTFALILLDTMPDKVYGI